MSLTLGINATTLRILNYLSTLDSSRATTMARLATSHRITKASDDPSGLVALNALNGELSSVNAALTNNQRAQSMLDVTDSTLSEVSTLVSEIESMTLAAQGNTMSTEEKMAYQAQIDNAVDAIDRLVNRAEFNGKKIFGGENRINATTNSAPSIKDIRVYSRDPNQTGSMTMSINVTAGASYAYTASATGASSVTLSAATVLQVTGKYGTATITLSNGLTSAQTRAAINAYSEVTGVSAIKGANDRLVFMSTTKGSDAFVSVTEISGATQLQAVNNSKVSGSDAQVLVNGERANAQGTVVYASTNGVSLSFNLADDTVGSTRTITINGGGATFQLGADSRSQATIGLGYVNSQELGRYDLATGGGYLSTLKSGGANSLTASGTKAATIAREAANQIAGLQARVGSFTKYAVDSTINTLNATKEGLTSAIEQIDGVDYTTETAALDRQNIMINVAMSMLTIANSRQNNVLTLFQ